MRSDWHDLLTGEMLAFALIGRAFYLEPDRAWLESLVDEDVFAQAPFAANQPDVIAGLGRLQAWSLQNRGGMSEQAFEAVRSDYTRLFVGLGEPQVAPWESVYFNDDRLTFQKETLQVRTWYRRFGLEADRLYREPDDHIGLELEFVAHLARLGVSALKADDAVALQQSLDAQRGFLSEHLLVWVPIVLEQIEKYSRTDFYRGLALFLRGALKQAAEMVRAKTPGEG